MIIQKLFAFNLYCFDLNALRTQNTTMIKADVCLAVITQLIGIILAKSIH